MADVFLLRKGGGEDVTAEVNEQATIIQEIQEALLGKVYGANATPETILKGYSAYVHQNLIDGTYEPMSGIDFGEVTLTSPQDQFSVNHNLGSEPKIVMVFPSPGNPYNNSYTWAILQSKELLLTSNVNQFGWYASGGSYGYISTANQCADMTESNIVYKKYSSYKFYSTTYRWIALA